MPPWRAMQGRKPTALVLVYLFLALLSVSCTTVGNGFAFSIAPSPRQRTATSAEVGPCRSTAASPADSTQGVDGSRQVDIMGLDDFDDDEAGIEDDFDDEDDDIHPSVAWLYPAAATTEDTGGSTSDGKRRRRKPSRRTLCVDYGTRRLGLAIGVGISPRTVPGITNRGSDLDVARQVLVRARGEGIRDIVVGLPLVRRVILPY